MSSDENPNVIKVIRLSDGLVMDFKMLMKNPSTTNQRYWGTVPVGQIDVVWLNSYRQNQQNPTQNQTNFVS